MNERQIAYQPYPDESFVESVHRINQKFSQMKNDILSINITDQNAEEMMEKFKAQKLPLARIKKIMKSDEEVRVSSFLLIISFVFR